MKLLDDLRMRKKVREMLAERKTELEAIKKMNDPEEKLKTLVEVLDKFVDNMIDMLK